MTMTSIYNTYVQLCITNDILIIADFFPEYKFQPWNQRKISSSIYYKTTQPGSKNFPLPLRLIRSNLDLMNMLKFEFCSFFVEDENYPGQNLYKSGQAKDK